MCIFITAHTVVMSVDVAERVVSEMLADGLVST